jgi:hypothetical protein
MFCKCMSKGFQTGCDVVVEGLMGSHGSWDLVRDRDGWQGVPAYFGISTKGYCPSCKDFPFVRASVLVC